MSMKIGILTFHCANNNGAVLQCYALQEYIKTLGHEVYVIDYRPDYVAKRYVVFSFRRLLSKNLIKTFKRICTEPYLYHIQKKRQYGIDEFVSNKMNLYPYNSDIYNAGFDAIILGSDQIWNPKLTGKGFDEVLGGSGFSCKKISYAASNRSSSLNNVEKDFYIAHLKELDAIGVRESTLQTLLQS